MAKRIGIFSLLLLALSCGDEPASNGPVCGNASVDEGEACDDGNEVAGDGCEPDCTHTPCADGDADGVCDEDDVCPGYADELDSDGDGVPNGCDTCEGETVDRDGDGIPDACDTCPDDPVDEDDLDDDGVCNTDDVCAGADDRADRDSDGVPDACDGCPDDPVGADDGDGDGVCDSDDVCTGNDDTLDADEDGLPDGCDPCPTDVVGADDEDGDGVCNSDDICAAGDDAVDTDRDGTPDACDRCPLDAAGDTDGDGVCDSDDRCPGFSDDLDDDADGVPDGCDPCPVDAGDDSDGDSVCDSEDVCDGSDDREDGDTDGVPDGCDVCPAGDDGADADGDSVPDACDCEPPGIPCSEFASCAIVAGAAECECREGFVGDGAVCEDVDECAADEPPCDPLVTCSNVAGSWTCGECPDGYGGSGSDGCEDIDECSALESPCDPLTECANLDGSFDCGPCPDGYDGDGLVGCRLRPRCGGSEVVTSIATGYASTCAAFEDGGVRCWGFNWRGQLGQGDTQARGLRSYEMGGSLPPVDLGPGARVVRVESSGGAVCVVLADASLRCWGYNDLGILGLGDRENRGDDPGEMGDALPRVQFPEEGAIVELSMGGKHNCVVIESGNLYCWGANGPRLGFTQVGLVGDQPGEMESLPAVSLGVGVLAHRVAAGVDHSCAITRDSRVKCWGEASFAALGYGDEQDRGVGGELMGDDLPYVDFGGSAPAVDIGAGMRFTCVLTEVGEVRCWGRGEFGELGNGNTGKVGDDRGEMGSDLVPVLLPPGRHATALTVGNTHACVILDDASVRCWGDGRLGQLGNGDYGIVGDELEEMGDALEPVALPAGTTPLQIRAGVSHTCALLDDGTVRCWGGGGYGQLGIGAPTRIGDEPGEMGDSLRPVDLSVYACGPCDPGFESVDEECIDVDECLVDNGGCGPGAACVNLEGGSSCAACPDGTLGDGWSGCRAPLSCTTPRVRVHSGGACVLLDGGSVKCWSRGWSSSSMGDGLTPFDFGEHRYAVRLWPGCAEFLDGSLRCWGGNSHGELGIEDTEPHTGLRGAELGNYLPTVDLGADFELAYLCSLRRAKCALSDEGEVKCWGSGEDGRTGLGHTENVGDEPSEMGDDLDPVDLGGGVVVESIACGDKHACALTDSGQVKCWGLNDFGQLGYGDVESRGDDPGEMGDALPFVHLTRPAVHIAAGRRHTCAVLDDASVRCWGANDHGELGQGDSEARGDEPDEMGPYLEPIRLLPDSEPVAVYGFWTSTCVLDRGNRIYCWGDNDEGQLGMGHRESWGIAPEHMGDGLTPIDLGTDAQVLSLDGSWYICASLDDGTVRCWGRNDDGNLGLGDRNDRGDEPGEMGAALPPVDLGSSSHITCAPD